jgi:hypothetical protein
MASSPCPFRVSFANWFHHQIKGWVKPTTVTLALCALADVSRSKADLPVENAILRRQSIAVAKILPRAGLNPAKITRDRSPCW